MFLSISIVDMRNRNVKLHGIMFLEFIIDTRNREQCEASLDKLLRIYFAMPVYNNFKS